MRKLSVQSLSSPAIFDVVKGKYGIGKVVGYDVDSDGNKQVKLYSPGTSLDTLMPAPRYWYENIEDLQSV